MSTLDEMTENRKRRDTNTAEAEALDADLTRLVKKALEEDQLSTSAVAEHLGVSRARVYQIRDGRR